MASTIAAVITGGGGVVTTADASGNLNLLAGTTTVVSLTTAGATVPGTLGVTGVATLGNGAILGTPASLVGTNITGTASGLTAGNVTTNANLTGGVTSVGNAATVITNANLTGAITSVGNATSVAAQTGTGSTFVMQASPTLTTPNIGTPSAGTVTNLTGTASININGTVGATTPAAGAFTTVIATGAISGHVASRVVMDYSPGGGRIWGYGVNAGTIGEVAIQLRSSDGSLGATAATFSSTGLAVTGTLSTTNGATLKTVNDGFVDVIDTSEVSGQGTAIRFANYVATDGFRKAGIFYKSVGDAASRGNLIFAAHLPIDSNNVTSADAVITITGSTGLTSVAYGLAVTGTLSATGLITSTNNTGGFVANRSAVTDYTGTSYQTASVKKWFLGMRENLSSNNLIVYDESSAVDRLTISTTGLAVTGTLSASGATTLATTLVVTAASNALGLVINGRSSDNLGALYYYANNGSTQHATIIASASELQFSSVPAAAVQTFRTNGSERMRIDSSGNVGIGTTAPTNLLHVHSTVTAADAVVARFESQLYGAPSYKTIIEIGTQYNDGSSRIANVNTSGNSSDLVFYPHTGTGSVWIEALRLSSLGAVTIPGTLGVTGTTALSGFVGIGVAASVSNALEVAGDIRLQGGNNSYKFNNGLVEFKLSQVAGATAAASLNANFSVTGSLSKGSGSFRISHPLPTLNETHNLVHSFIEGPQADLIYRGQVVLVAGKATVNIDTAATMTEGTFELLCRDVQCFTSNETDWNHVRGSVVGNILTIECQDIASIATISWMVIGERKDPHIMETEWTDDDGKVIVEPLKPISLVNIASPQEKNHAI